MSQIEIEVDVLDVTSARVTWVIQNQNTHGDIGNGDTKNVVDNDDNLVNVDNVEIIYSPSNTISYTVLPVTNPLVRSVMLPHLMPFTQYQVMVRMMATNMTHLTRITSNTVIFTTSVSLQQQLQQQKLVLGDTRDALIVIFILVIWMVVILLFLHRWGRYNNISMMLYIHFTLVLSVSCSVFVCLK